MIRTQANPEPHPRILDVKISFIKVQANPEPLAPNPCLKMKSRSEEERLFIFKHTAYLFISAK